jgi:hypothetical protein
MSTKFYECARCGVRDAWILDDRAGSIVDLEPDPVCDCCWVEGQVEVSNA